MATKPKIVIVLALPDRLFTCVRIKIHLLSHHTEDKKVSGGVFLHFINVIFTRKSISLSDNAYDFL